MIEKRKAPEPGLCPVCHQPHGDKPFAVVAGDTVVAYCCTEIHAQLVDAHHADPKNVALPTVS